MKWCMYIYIYICVCLSVYRFSPVSIIPMTAHWGPHHAKILPGNEQNKTSNLHIWKSSYGSHNHQRLGGLNENVFEILLMVFLSQNCLNISVQFWFKLKIDLWNFASGSRETGERHFYTFIIHSRLNMNQLSAFRLSPDIISSCDSNCPLLVPLLRFLYPEWWNFTRLNTLYTQVQKIAQTRTECVWVGVLSLADPI